MPQERLTLILIGEDGKVIDEKLIFINDRQDAIIDMHTRGFEEEYQIRSKE